MSKINKFEPITLTHKREKTLNIIYTGDGVSKKQIKLDTRITFLQEFLLNKNVKPILQKDIPEIKKKFKP